MIALLAGVGTELRAPRWKDLSRDTTCDTERYAPALPVNAALFVIRAVRATERLGHVMRSLSTMSNEVEVALKYSWMTMSCRPAIDAHGVLDARS